MDVRDNWCDSHAECIGCSRGMLIKGFDRTLPDLHIRPCDPPGLYDNILHGAIFKCLALSAD